MLLLLLSSGALLLGACNGGAGDETSSSTVPAASSVPPESTPSSSASASDAPTGTTSLTPVPKVFDAVAMQNSVQQILTQSYGIEGVESVTCPPAKPVRVGETFDCTAQVAGETKRVPITVKSADGHYEVGQLK